MKKQKELKNNNLKKIVKLFFEMGQLRRVRHIGFTCAGVDNPDSVAEHTARVAQIGFILADMEKADSYKVTVMCLFHDLGEARVNDAHRIATRYYSYFKLKNAEFRAFQDQVSILPNKSGKTLLKLMSEFEERKTLEAKCAKDADYLDQAVSAKEYIDIGYKGCKDWLKNIKKALKTESAKKLLSIIEKTDRNDWWDNLKDLKEVLSK